MKKTTIQEKPMDKLLWESNSVSRNQKINPFTPTNQMAKQKVVTQEEFIKRLRRVKFLIDQD
jgi:hypothetical protein